MARWKAAHAKLDGNLEQILALSVDAAEKARVSAVMDRLAEYDEGFLRVARSAMDGAFASPRAASRAMEPYADAIGVVVERNRGIGPPP